MIYLFHKWFFLSDNQNKLNFYSDKMHLTKEFLIEYHLKLTYQR